MPIDMEQEDADRFKVLNALYEAVRDRGGAMVPSKDVFARSALERKRFFRALQYLIDDGLIAPQAFNCLQITHYGTKSVELALRKPQEATDLFPPVNLIYAETISNSTIQQAGNNAVQSATLNADSTEELAGLIAQLVSSLQSLKLAVPQMKALAADLDTMTAQLKSPAPKKSILDEAWRSARHVLENAGGGVLGQSALTIMSAISAALGG